MRAAPSQTATVSLPTEMLSTVDQAAAQMGATRSELVRAALRDYLRRWHRDQALLSRLPVTPAGETEEELAALAVKSQRSQRRPRSV